MLFLSHSPPFDSFYIFHLSKGQQRFLGGMGNMGNKNKKYMLAAYTFYFVTTFIHQSIPLDPELLSGG